MRFDAFPYFFIAFASAGLQVIIPQHHFAERPDDERFVLLSTCLVLGAVGRLLGIWTSQWVRPGRAATGLAVLAFGATLSGTVWGAPDAAYIALFAAANLLSQLVFDALDRRLVWRWRDDIEAHVRGATAMQLLGLVAAPVWFGVLAGVQLPHHVVVAAGVGLLAVVVSGLPDRSAAAPGDGKRGAPDPQELAFLGFGMCIYAATFSFSATFLYVVRDLYRIDQATAVAGIGIGLVNGVAIVTVVIARRFSAHEGDPAASWRPSAHLQTVVVLGSALVLLALRPFGGVGFVYGLALPVGVVHGLFMLRARAFASARALRPGRSGFLSLYNNLSNAAALGAFGLNLGLSYAAAASGASYLLLSLGCSALLAFAGGGIAAASMVRRTS